MNLSFSQMMMQDCYSWKPREIKVCSMFLENTSVRGLTNSEFLFSVVNIVLANSTAVVPCYWAYVRLGSTLSLLEFGVFFEVYS